MNDEFTTGSAEPSLQIGRRAEAAERTVQVLKKKVFELYNGGSTSALHKQMEKARRRDEENRRKREIIEIRADELKRYSETLEIEVARRTEAIKTILDNVTFGFLIVNRELAVQPESTKSCLRLFGVERVEGCHLADLLTLGNRARQEFLLSVDQVFEDILPIEASVGQMPRKFPMKSGRTLEVEAGVVRTASGEVGSLLFTISDITALEAAMRENANNRTLVGILRQKESFRNFLGESKQQLDAASRAITEGHQHAARQAIHTIKGNAASYLLGDITNRIHQVEETSEIRTDQIDEIHAALRVFLEAHHGVLEIRYDEVGDEGFEVTREQMGRLRTIISTLPGSEADELRRWTSRVLKRPARLLLGPVEDFTQKLAARLGKTVTLELNGADVSVDVEIMRPVLQIVPHLVRNAIDHGIERPLERGHKSRDARIRLDISEQQQGYTLRCHDDGRGINTSLLGRRAVEKSFFSSEAVERMNKEERLRLVFVDGLSSAEVTTTISGRGVGMSAVKAAVDRASGKIAIESTPNAGTLFTIVIPKLETS